MDEVDSIELMIKKILGDISMATSADQLKAIIEMYGSNLNIQGFVVSAVADRVCLRGKFEDSNEIVGWDDDFFNLGIVCIQLDYLREGIEILQKGCTIHKGNCDLHSAIVFNANKIGRNDISKTYLDALNANVPVQKWTEMTFDYILKYLSDVGDDGEFDAVVEKMKLSYPASESPYLLRSRKENNIEQRIAILEEGIGKVVVCPSLCFAMVNDLMSLGDYVGVIKYSTRGLAANAEMQPSVSFASLVLYRALAMDAILNMNLVSRKDVYEKDIDNVINEYELARDHSDFSGRKAAAIEQRIGLLKSMKNSKGSYFNILNDGRDTIVMSKQD